MDSVAGLRVDLRHGARASHGGQGGCPEPHAGCSPGQVVAVAMSDGRLPLPICVPAGHSASGYVHAVGGNAQGAAGTRPTPVQAAAFHAQFVQALNSAGTPPPPMARR